MTSFFAKHITHWFAETYVRGFALRKYRLVEAITFSGKKYCRRCEVYMYHMSYFAHTAERS
jgi:hypothetical protein